MKMKNYFKKVLREWVSWTVILVDKTIKMGPPVALFLVAIAGGVYYLFTLWLMEVIK